MSRVVWTIEIEAENDAFIEGSDRENIEHPERAELWEVGRLLRQAAHYAEDFDMLRDSEGRLRRPLYDYNGNTVGVIRRTVET